MIKLNKLFFGFIFSMFISTLVGLNLPALAVDYFILNGKKYVVTAAVVGSLNSEDSYIDVEAFDVEHNRSAVFNFTLNQAPLLSLFLKGATIPLRYEKTTPALKSGEGQLNGLSTTYVSANDSMIEVNGIVDVTNVTGNLKVVKLLKDEDGNTTDAVVRIVLRGKGLSVNAEDLPNKKLLFIAFLTLDLP